VGGEFTGQGLGEGHAGGAGDGGGGAAGAGGFGADVEHVDDAAPAAVSHLRPGEAGEADGGEEFEVEVLLPDFVGDGFEGAGAGLAGVVDDDVDAAEAVHDIVIGALDVGGFGDIALDGEDAAFGGGTDDFLINNIMFDETQLWMRLAAGHAPGNNGAFWLLPPR
jgi:hypothetical protein